MTRQEMARQELERRRLAASSDTAAPNRQELATQELERRRIKTEIPSQNQPLMDEPLGVAPVEGSMPTREYIEGVNDPMRAVREGATLGWGDEAEAGVSSLLGRGSYEDEQARISGTQKQFAEENPKTALGLNVAGGILTSPLGGTSKGLAQTVSRMAGEGALAGAGMGDPDERGEGALLGGVLGGGFGGLTNLGGQAIKRRLTKALGQGDDAIPYAVVAEEEGLTGLGPSFMDAIARNLPKSPMASQEREYAKKAVPALRQTIEAAQEKTIKENAERVAARKVQQQTLERGAETARQEVSEGATQSGYRIGDVAKKRAQVAQKELADFNDETRDMAFDAAIPMSQRGKVKLTGIAQEDVVKLKGAVKEGYEEAWKGVEEGTTEGAKNAKKEVTAFVNKTFDGFSGDDKSALKKMTADVKNLYAEGFPPAKIKALDNSLRKQITAAKDKPLLRQELSKLRENLRGSLDDKTNVKLDKMDAGYGDYLTVRKAVGKASDKGGAFTPQQLATSSRMVGGESRSATGKAPLQSLVDRGQVGARTAAQKTAKAGETAEAGKRFLTKAVGDKKIKITDEVRAKIDALPPAEKKSVQKTVEGYNDAVDKEKFLKKLRDNKPSLFYNLISLGAATGLGQIPLVGPTIGYTAATKAGQRAVAGQTWLQGALRKGAGATKNIDLGRIGNIDVGTSDIGNALRRGATVGGFNYFGE